MTCLPLYMLDLSLHVVQAVAYKLILSEQLPLTPQPSVIEQFVLFNILQFALQATFNCIVHLLSANLAEGYFGPNDEPGYVCQAESVTVASVA